MNRPTPTANPTSKVAPSISNSQRQSVDGRRVSMINAVADNQSQQFYHESMGNSIPLNPTPN